MIQKIKRKILNINHLKFKIIVNSALVMQWFCLLLSLFFLIEMSVLDLIVGIIFLYLSFQFYKIAELYTREYWKRWGDYSNVPKPNRFVRRRIHKKMKKNKPWH